MNTYTRILTAGIAPLLLSATALHAQDEVVHHFITENERDAIQTIADKFAEQGGEWVDNAAGNPMDARRVYTSLMQAGQPPSAYAAATNRDHVELVERGLLAPLDAVADAEGWRDGLPPAIVDWISVDDQIYLTPFNMLIPNFVLYNKRVFDELGLEEPKGFDEEFFATLDALKEAGIIPVAVSSDSFIVRFAFEAIMLDVGGRDLWYSVWQDRSEEAIRSDDMRAVLETFRRIRDYSDEGAVGRPWNLSSQMVANGEAGLQIVGSFATGIYLDAGMVPGEDLGCYVPSRDNLVEIHGDVFAYPVLAGEESLTEGQQMLASSAMDPGVQAEYASIRGTMPARIDVEIENPDYCQEISFEAYSADDALVQNPRSLISPQMDGDYRDIVNEFYEYPDMSVDEAVDRLVDALQAS